MKDNFNANVKTNVKTHLRTIAPAALLLAAGSAIASGTDTSNFDVTASVSSTCTITSTGGNLAFGAYDPVTGAAVTGTTTIAVTCSNGMSGTAVGLTNTGSMSDGASGTLTYGLYSDASHTTAWGNTDSVDRVAVTADGTQKSLTVYGKIDANQSTAPIGSYSETVTATVHW